MKKSITVLVVFGFIASLVLISSQALAEEEGWIEGTVTTGIFPAEPVQGATVAVEGTTVTATTDADGKFNVTVPVGTYTVKVTKTNYDDYTKENVQVTNATTKTVSISISKSKGNIKGKVTDKESGDPIDFAWVQVEGDYLLPPSDFTDESGEFEITGLSVGTYTLNCSKMGSYKDSKTTVTVKANQDVTVDFKLEALEVILIVKVQKLLSTDALSGAKVTIDGKEGTTGPDGTVTFKDLERKSYDVTIKKSGYIKYDSFVDLTSGSKELTVQMVKKSDVDDAMFGLAALGFVFCILPIIIIIIVIIVVVVLLLRRKKKKAAAAPPPQQPMGPPPGQQPPQQDPYAGQNLYGQQQQPPSQPPYQPPPQY